MRHKANLTVLIGVLLLFSPLLPGGKSAGAESPEEFFRGKTLTWIVASDPGSSTDLIARTIAPFLAAELGAKVRVESRKTDEGFNFLYNKASRDGLVLAVKDSDSIIGNDILKAPGVLYETEKFNFLADAFPSFKLFQISPKLPYKTIEALKKAKGLRAGGTSAKGSLALSSAVMLEILGLDGKVITGYQGKKDLTLALARGEVDCMVPSDNTAFRDEKDGYVVNLMTTGFKRSIAVPHAPTLTDLGIQIPRELLSVHKFVTSSGTAVALPPGVPPERVEYLRKAFLNLGNHKDFPKAMEKLTGQYAPFLPGAELQRTMTEIKADTQLATKIDGIFKKYTAIR